MKTNIDRFSTDSYYLAANAKAFLAKLKEDSDFIYFLADVMLKHLSDDETLHLTLEDDPYTIYIDDFADGLSAISNLSLESPRVTAQEVTFREEDGALFANLKLHFYVAEAEFTYDYMGKLFGPDAPDFAEGDISFSLASDIKLPSSTPVDNLPAYEFHDVHLTDATVEGTRSSSFRYDSYRDWLYDQSLDASKSS